MLWFGDSTLAKLWVCNPVEKGCMLKVRATLTREGAAVLLAARGDETAEVLVRVSSITELACGSQAFIATLLFDPSMSALPIIPKQNSVSVGLFTH